MTGSSSQSQNQNREPRYRKPAAGPTRNRMEDLERWDELTRNSHEQVRTAAEKWRIGLAASFTLVVSALLVAGPDATSTLPEAWRVSIALLIGGGLASAVAALWLSLRAAAGSPGPLDLPQVVREYGGVRQFEVAGAIKAAKTLQRSRRVASASMVMLVGAVTLWWLAPQRAADPPAMIAVETASTTICGTLESGRDNEFRISVEGEPSDRIVGFDQVEQVRLVTDC